MNICIVKVLLRLNIWCGRIHVIRFHLYRGQHRCFIFSTVIRNVPAECRVRPTQIISFLFVLVTSFKLKSFLIRLILLAAAVCVCRQPVADETLARNKIRLTKMCMYGRPGALRTPRFPKKASVRATPVFIIPRVLTNQFKFLRVSQRTGSRIFSGIYIRRRVRCKLDGLDKTNTKII